MGAAIYPALFRVVARAAGVFLPCGCLPYPHYAERCFAERCFAMLPLRRIRPTLSYSIGYSIGSVALLVALLAALFSTHPTASAALAAAAPPRTATPSRCGVCQLSVRSVSITCNPDG